MYKGIFILFALISQFVQGQTSFKALVSSSPVMEGESFRVQYIIEGAENFGNFLPPSFRGFRLVRGPEIYTSNRGTAAAPHTLRNMIYTLQAREPGRYYIPGATAVVNSKTIVSNDVVIEVVSAGALPGGMKEQGYTDESDNSVYLKPGEDPHEKIRQNLFMKVLLDKKTCYPGEPVVATFKLYSRLQSRSDIIKNPGFYGFAVQDMINLDDRVVATELVNGKMFDVHTVRKVQLYPLQAGNFTIDAMEVKNRVEFSRSRVSRKAEQEISEGVIEEDDVAPMPGIEVFETNTGTKPVMINVRPLPVRNKPADYNDATGQFSITAVMEDDRISKNEEGFFVITISGEGNFHQLVAPIINWPEGIEGFEPGVSDQFDKAHVPIRGWRKFRYALVAAKPGRYELPSVTLSYFDPDSNRYRKAVSKPVSFSVDNRKKATPEITAELKKEPIAAINRKASYVAAGIVGILVLIAVLYWLVGIKRKKPVAVEKEAVIPVPSGAELIREATIVLPAADRDFYTVLHQSIWNWLSLKFSMTGMGMSKYLLIQEMSHAGYDQITIDQLLGIIGSCESGMYTNAVLDIDRVALLYTLKKLADEINDKSGEGA